MTFSLGHINKLPCLPAHTSQLCCDFHLFRKNLHRKIARHDCKHATHDCQRATYDCQHATYDCQHATYDCQRATYDCQQVTHDCQQVRLVCKEFPHQNDLSKTFKSITFAALKNTIIQNERHNTFAMLQKLIVPIAVFSFFISACGSMPDKTAWDRVQGHLTTDTLEWFLKEYPNSEYHKDASAKLEDMYWQEASHKNTVFFFLKYANRFPNGQYVDNAMRKVSELPKDSILPGELENRAFIGQLDVKGEEPHLLSLRFGKTVKDVETDTLQFVADLNIGDQKTELRGFIEIFDNSVHFLQGDSLNRILYTNGKLYKRDGKLFMESTGTEQYWMLSN